MKATSRERLLQALRFENVDMIPIMGRYEGALVQFGGPFLGDKTIPREN